MQTCITMKNNSDTRESPEAVDNWKFQYSRVYVITYDIVVTLILDNWVYDSLRVV